MYKIALAIIYWMGVLQYISESFPNIINIYEKKIDIDKKCQYNFTVQLTFWIGVLFAIFFSIPKENNYFLFSIIILQLVVTLGRLFQVKERKKIYSNYSYILFHWTSFIIAIYFIFYKLKHLKLLNLLYTFLIPLFYLFVFYLYHIIYREENCEPEKYFNILTKQGIIHTCILCFLYIFISLIVDYVFV